MKKIGVFISGNGSNLEAIIKGIKEGKINGDIALVISNRKDAYEKRILRALKEKGILWLILAGYLILVGPTLLNAYKGKIINIHPALLPNYKRLDSIRRAYESGEKIIGVTVHYVDEGMDTGPIIKQGFIKGPEHSTLEAVETRVHNLEHRLYVEALGDVLSGGKS